MVNLVQTIAALSSGSLPSGVAVLRLSGPAAFSRVGALVRSLPAPRHAALRTLRDPQGQVLDRAIVILFPGPGSVTGEDLAELHLHGGRAVVAACLAALTAGGDIRLAEAGEFTRRSFENGRIDLTEAEGLGDLLAAETEGQRKQAIAQAGGAMRTLCEGWMGRLTHSRAMLEADFDFADEGDVADGVAEGVSRETAALIGEMQLWLASARQGEILRDGFKVAIMGAPNAGKSSLLNALAERDVAIVSDMPGTTRDRIEVSLDLAGIPVRLIDTAGLRETADTVERMGIERAIEAGAAADLVLHLVAPGEPVPVLQVAGVPVWLLATKADLAAKGGDELAISARTGQGLEDLVRRIAGLAAEAAGDPATVVPTRTRHREIVSAAVETLLEADFAVMPPEICAEILRSAADRLATLVGRRGVEDLLDVIFSQFCIGK